MNTPYVSIGIDVSKTWLDIYGIGRKRLTRITNDAEGIARLVALLMETSPDVIVCEPSGGYERTVVAAATQAGLPITVVNARQVRDFARAKGVLAKTDRLDAVALAEYGVAFRPTPRHGSPDPALAAYVSRRRQVVETLRRERCHREQAVCEAVRHLHERSCEARSEWKTTAISKVLSLVSKLRWNNGMRASAPPLPPTRKPAENTASSPVAPVSAMSPPRPPWPNYRNGEPSLTPESPQLAGLAPFNHDGGSLRGQRHIRGGRASVRHALYMAAVSAVRYNPDIRKTYLRLRNEGKHAKVALVAAMRKLIITLNSLLRDNRKWKPIYSPQP